MTKSCDLFTIDRPLVRDSSAVRLFFRFAGAVGCQRALHTENSGFVQKGGRM